MFMNYARRIHRESLQSELPQHQIFHHVSQIVKKLHLMALFADVMSVDTSGIVALEELHREFVSQGIQVSFISFLYTKLHYTLVLT